MYISHYGYTCFKIQSSSKVTIITDIFDKSIGLRPPSPKAEVLTFSCAHYDASAILKGIHGDSSPFVISTPGEYETLGIIINGIAARHGGKLAKESFGSTVYTFQIDGMSLCHLGDIGQKELDEDQLDAVGDIDILMIPVGGDYLLDYKAAVHIVNQIEPRVILPMAYDIKGLKLKLDKLNFFLKEIGLSPKEKVEKLRIVKKDLPQEDTMVIEFKV